MANIQLSDLEMFCQDVGRGQPLLLVHGFPLDHRMWRHQIASFRNSHRVLAPDLRGFGRTSVTAGTVTMARMADDLDALLAAMDISEPITFCGLSMGGYVGLEMVTRHRSRLSRLVLSDTRAANDLPEVAKGRGIMAHRLETEGIGFVAESMPTKLFAPETQQQRGELVAETVDVMNGTLARGAASAARGMAIRKDFSDRLDELDLPTLVLCGEYDEVTPPSEMREMAKRAPQAVYVGIPRAGHMSPLENPDDFNLALAGFLNGPVD